MYPSVYQIDESNFVTTFEKMGKWSQIAHKISSFQPIFKDNQHFLICKFPILGCHLLDGCLLAPV